MQTHHSAHIFRTGLSFITLLSLLLCACDFSFKKKSEASSAPALKHSSENAPKTERKEKTEDQAEPQKDISLSKGQTQEDVIKLLGKPSGTMTISNRTSLIYNGVMLEFENGKLTEPITNVLSKISARSTSEQPSKETESSGNRFGKIKPQKHYKDVIVKDKRDNKVDHSRLTSIGKITVVDFYATWCGPCQRAAPIIKDICRGQSDVILRKIDIGQFGSPIAIQYGIDSVPNFRVFDKRGLLVGPPTSNPNRVKRYIREARDRY